MAQVAGTLAGQVGGRVRDPDAQATPTSSRLSLLSYAQIAINAILGDVVQSASLAITAGQQVYQLSSVLPNAIKVLRVTDSSGVDFEPTPFEPGLRWIDMNWLGGTSGKPRVYAQCGRDVLVIYPNPTVNDTLTVYYSKLTATITTGSQVTEVPNEDDDAVMDLTEILLLLHDRDLNGVAAAIKRWQDRLARLKGEVRGTP